MVEMKLLLRINQHDQSYAVLPVTATFRLKTYDANISMSTVCMHTCRNKSWKDWLLDKDN